VLRTCFDFVGGDSTQWHSMAVSQKKIAKSGLGDGAVKHIKLHECHRTSPRPPVGRKMALVGECHDYRSVDPIRGELALGVGGADDPAGRLRPGRQDMRLARHSSSRRCRPPGELAIIESRLQQTPRILPHFPTFASPAESVSGDVDDPDRDGGAGDYPAAPGRSGVHRPRTALASRRETCRVPPLYRGRPRRLPTVLTSEIGRKL
jgi:hypothetical protein